MPPEATMTGSIHRCDNRTLPSNDGHPDDGYHSDSERIQTPPHSSPQPRESLTRCASAPLTTQLHTTHTLAKPSSGPLDAAVNAWATTDINVTGTKLLPSHVALERLSAFFRSLSAEPHLTLRILESVYDLPRIQRLLRRRQHSYNPSSHRLQVYGMSRPVHDAMGRFVSLVYGEMRSTGWLTGEESPYIETGLTGVKLARSRFRVGQDVKKFPAWTKYPDAVINFGGRSRRPIPSVVFEVGFSERYEDLESDIRQWLDKAARKVQVVVLVDIQEDMAARRRQARSDDAQARVKELLMRFGNEQAKEKYSIKGEDGDTNFGQNVGSVDVAMVDVTGNLGHEANDDEEPGDVSFTTESDEYLYDAIATANTPEDWVGPITVTMEIWRRIDGKPTRAVGGISVLPKDPTQSDPVLKITDIIPPQHRGDFTQPWDSTRTWPLNLDQYRDFLRVRVQELALLRALDLLRPRKKDHVVREEQAYSTSEDSADAGVAIGKGAVG
ncbi:hypothetical protein K440DRAFT_665379 [Wilcoxina mikolae CBS 423.85]|nr:hypothetical protein K440DRAFT_665379 [Wilcoxina mikolae CBS 423.85]